MRIHNKVKEVRLKLSLSQSVLAKKVGTTRVTIYNIENNVHVPGLDLAYKIAKALDVTVETLFEVIDP